MNIILSNGLQLPITLQEGAEVGHIRTLRRELEEIGAPSTFTFAVNSVGVEDNHVLTEGAIVSFRPKSGEKGTDPEVEPTTEGGEATQEEATPEAPAEGEASADATTEA